MTIEERIKNIENSAVISGGNVKSVQRGTVAYASATNFTTPRAISISAVDLAKSVLIVNGPTLGLDPSKTGSYFCTVLTSTAIQQYPGANGVNPVYAQLAWQVIEFY